MIDRDWFWASVDDALAAIGFLFVLFPVLAVVTTYVDVPGIGKWVVLVLLSAAAGAVYRERGHDIGDLGTFVLAATVAFLPVALLVSAVLLLAGLEVLSGGDGAVMIAGAYAIAYWYAYRGGRERVRRSGSEAPAESA